MRPVEKLTKMREHVENLAAAHGIRLCTQFVKRSDRAYALREAGGAADEVHTAPIRSAITYATALHEIGHILGRYQSSRRPIVREVWAWRWAQANALKWTPTMEKVSQDALGWAIRNAHAGL